MNTQMQFSNRVKSIPQALSIYINQIVYDQKRKGKDITALSLGEAFFDIPRFDFGKLDFVKGYHYSDSQGIPELRKKIADFYKRQYNAEFNADSEILISAGSKPIIYMAMLATLNEGDEILIHEPAWLSYQEQARLLDVTPKFIPYDCQPKDFHKYFTPKTKMVVINNPNNPSGRIYTKSELSSIYEQSLNHGTYVMVDEAYSDFIGKDQFYSMVEVAPSKEGIIVVNSLSKNMGMSGWRVGYVIGAPDLIEQILKVNQHLITCAPTILQQYMATYFDDVTSTTLPQVREVVEKRDRIRTEIESLGLKHLGGHSTFYFFIDIGDFSGTSFEFALHMLLVNQVAVVPGSAYGESVERFVRVSIGTEPEERIHDALLMMRDLSRQKNFDKDRLYKKIQAEGLKMFENNVL